MKLCFDDKTGKLLRVLTGEEHENEGMEIGLDRALQQALQVMFKLFPNAHECFRLETLDEEELGMRMTKKILLRNLMKKKRN